MEHRDHLVKIVALMLTMIMLLTACGRPGNGNDDAGGSGTGSGGGPDGSQTGGDMSGSGLEDLFSADVLERAVAALQDAAAVYAGSSHVAVTGGERKEISEEDPALTAVREGGTVEVPLCFFENYMGAAVALAEKSYTVTLGDVTLRGEAGSAAYSAGGSSGELPKTARSLNGTVYLPVAAVARALGWQAVEDGRLVTVSPHDISVLERPVGVNELSEAVACMVAEEDRTAADITQADIDQVKANWLYMLVGSEEDNDPSDPNVAEKLSSIESKGAKAHDAMEPKGTEDKCFSSDGASASADMTSTAGRIYNMAVAYGTPGCPSYQDETLRDDIIYALDWFAEHRYGHNEVEGHPWRDTSLHNWWDWDIGTPDKIVKSLLIMEKDLKEAGKDLSQYLVLFDQRSAAAKRTGTNALYIGQLAIGSALLQNDAEKVLKIQRGLRSVFQYVDNGRNLETYPADPSRSKGAGFYTDGSYVFHRLSPMNGGYGMEQLTLTGPFLSMFAGTGLAFTFPGADSLADWIFDASDRLIYQGKMFRMVLGRHPTSGQTAVQEAMKAMIDSLASLDEEDRARMRSIIREYVETDPDTNYYAALSLPQGNILKKIMSDDSVTARDPQIFDHVYYNEDKVVHQRGDWALGLSLSSSRIFNYESINGENLTGWYISDGMTEYWTRNDFTQQPEDYWKLVDPYRLPGTTVDTQERKELSLATDNAYLSSQDFVGAASLEDTWGTAAMQLESYHNESGEEGTPGQQNGPAPDHRSDLMAKKAWFLFDDEVVALGTDIDATNGAEVLTVVDNKRSVSVRELSAPAVEPYQVVGVTATAEPEPENPAVDSIDGDYASRWAAEGGSITFDLGESRELGFAALAFLKGSTRYQQFTLEVSEDNETWTTTFEGHSSGKTEEDEYYDLGGHTGRYIRFTNRGNSAGGMWVSLSEAKFYAPNASGEIGIPQADIVGADAFVADGVELDLTAQDQDLTDLKWAWFENSGGYYFPEGGTVRARYTNSRNSFLELWFSHGTDPVDGTYAYALLPGKGQEETAAYAADPDIQVLANTPALQAVKEKELGITGLVFWEAGSFGGITVDRPMIVMVRETEDGLIISACDPTQKAAEGTLTVSGAFSAEKADIMTEVACAGDAATVQYDFTGSMGRSMEVTLRKS